MITAKRRLDYQPPQFNVAKIHLDFSLTPEQTRVINTMQIQRISNSDTLTLDGVEQTLVSVKLNGEYIDDYSLTETQLVIPVTLDEFSLVIETTCEPEKNTALEGLYYAADAFCTQCEAEGFRRITYFLDRPDVLSEYTVTITADKTRFPYMLSNGNKIGWQNNQDGTHTVTWHDPHLKPCYLFALVAGDFDLLSGQYTTVSGRDVALEMYVEKGRQSQAQHALDSLIKSMRWDEETYNLEYDLDIYMIVATDFFNMGAMENKGLNVFNSKFVLADAETATDEDYFNIESVIGHEYFHNWTGNRVTCRDWFQLSLKEGLTVFRDQQFSADVTAPLTTRIKQINLMRAQQFAEDASAMAHPIRPDEVIEMNNFYTLTVYDKGAEVIRMQQTLLGEAGFKKGIALYFERHDGQAVTCDDFVNAMGDANDFDMSLFKRWYSQSGTPEVTITSSYDKSSRTRTYKVCQFTPSTADQSQKHALLVPLEYECVDKNGKQYNSKQDLRKNLIALSNDALEVTFDDVPEDATALFNLGFSAPVKVKTDYSVSDWRHIFAHSRNPYATWEAGQSILKQMIADHYYELCDNPSTSVSSDEFSVFEHWLTINRDKPELISEVLHLPTVESMLAVLGQADIQMAILAIKNIETALAKAIFHVGLQLFNELQVSPEYAYTPEQMHSRKLKNTLLYYIALVDAEQFDWQGAFSLSTNMTERLGLLKAAQRANVTSYSKLLEKFADKFGSDAVVMDKWFALQATQDSDDILSQLDLLQAHPLFALNNPNKVRALIGNFAFYNHAHFHAEDGSGYAYLCDFILRFDAINAQVASRLVTPLTQWQQLAPSYQTRLISQCRRLLDHSSLSKDVFEKVSKSVLQYESSN